MTMNTRVTGNIEIITGPNPEDRNHSVAVYDVDPADVPMLARVLFQVGEVAEAPLPAKAGKRVKGTWKARDARQRAVTVLLHEETPFDETLVAQAIATALAEREGTR